MPKIKSLSRIAWEKLTSSQKSDRNLAFEILRMMKSGNSLTLSSKTVGLSINSTKSHLGRAIIKKSGRWFPSKSNSIQRGMQIYENGRIKSIVVRNSKDASLIGEYYNEVRNALISGDYSKLKKFRTKIITDPKGKKHRLETNPKNIIDIEDSKESSELYEVYEDE